jgi:L-ornithine N5-oxygenase
MFKTDVYDIFGIGFGPAGIALATALEDEEEMTNGIAWSKKFIEKNSDSTWMPEMLLPGTDIQHHFLRDFATPRNPRSKYTFPNYLQKNGRLFSFGLLNHPSRIEWSDYVKWVAEQVSHNTSYNQEVLEVEPVIDNQNIEKLKVISYNHTENKKEIYYARNLVINSGRKPYVPQKYKPYLNNNIFHSSKFNSTIKKIKNKGENQTFTVVGSGQNAIEIILYLANKYPDAHINSVIRHTGFRLYELGHFTNEVFFPEFTDYFVGLSQTERDNLFEQIKYTNYSSVDEDVSKALYWKMYEDKIQNKNRIKLFRCSEIMNIQEVGYETYELDIKDIYNKKNSSLTTNHMIFCTGFYEEKIPSVLEPIKNYLKLNENEELTVSKDYQALTEDHFKPGIYLNGLTEKSHGIGDSASFTMMAVKAQRILDKLNKTKHDSTKEYVEVTS